MQGAFGVDFGSSRTVFGAATRGGVNILANEGSHRETGNYIGYGKKQRFIGETGAAQKVSNFKNTINFFNRFLGMTPENPNLQEEMKYITAKVITEDSKINFSVTYQDQPLVLSPVQVTATMINKIRKLIQREGFEKVDNLVLSVPSYYTEAERKALMDACKMADIPLSRLYNETSAISLSYGIFRKKELTKDPKNVVFIDLGHSKLSAFCTAFTNEKCEILAEAHARNVGCRNIDFELLQHFAAKFNTQYGCNPMKNEKAKLRMLDSIEKVRKTLSANSEANLGIESLMEDEDMNYNIKRDELEELITPMLNVIKQTLIELKDILNQKNINYSDVEIVGGGTRIPCVQRIIEDVFQVTGVQRTLNASECIARGCSLMSAMLSPLFRVQDYPVVEYNMYNVRAVWKFQNQMEIEGEKEEKNNALLFAKGCNFGQIKSISFTKNGPFNLSLFNDPEIPGFNPLIASYDLQPTQIVEKEFKQKIRVKQTTSGLVELTEYAIEECYYEEDKKPEPKKKEETAENKDQAQEKTEEKKPELKQKFKTKQVRFSPSVINQLTVEVVNSGMESESQMNLNDQGIIQTLEKKNDLEALIYNMRNALQTELKEFVQQDTVPAFLQELDETENWLYDDGQDAKKSEYVQRLQKLQAFSNPIVQRCQEYNLQPELLEYMDKSLAKYEQLAKDTSELYDHIKVDEKASIISRAQELRKFIAENMEKQKTSPKYFDLIVSNQELRNKMSTFEKVNFQLKFGQNIMSQPKPKKEEPKKEEPKAEEPKKEANKQADKMEEEVPEQDDKMDLD